MKQKNCIALPARGDCDIMLVNGANRKLEPGISCFMPLMLALHATRVKGALRVGAQGVTINELILVHKRNAIRFCCSGRYPATSDPSQSMYSMIAAPTR